MRKVQIGVIGCGVISQIYLSNITQLYSWLDVRACADIVLETAQKTAQSFGIPKVYTVEELLCDKEIEIVLNLTIPQVHAQINTQALLAGKHVYCEKPLALDMQEVKDLIALAKEKNLLLGCAPDTFLGSALQTCRKVLDDGIIGTPICATANMVNHGMETWHPSPSFYYKKGGGPMLDMGSYYLSALVSLLGPIQKVAGFSNRGHAQREILSQPLRNQKIDVELDTNYSSVLYFENKVTANLSMSFDVWGSHLPKLELYGTEGTLVIPDPNWFDGDIYVLKSKSVLDYLDKHPEISTEHCNQSFYDQFYEKVTELYPCPRRNMRGLGLLDMAFALVNNRPYRTNPEFSYHITEAMLGFDYAISTNTVYTLNSACQRPKPIPLGLKVGELD